jgi:cytochrome c oxidase subunit 3
MSLIRELFEKPWETTPGVLALHGGRSFRASPETIALRVFLVVVTVLFSLLIAAYGVRMAFEDWRPQPEPWILWANTALLIASSVAFHRAWTAIHRGDRIAARQGLLLAGALAVGFLLGQVAAWRQPQAMQVFGITNPAIAFFYLITALHALHLLGGLAAWALTVRRLAQDGALDRVARQVRLCATYWHFLLGLWLVLFGLLFSGNENLEIILSICGLR